MGAGPPGMARRYRSDAFPPDSCQRLYLPGRRALVGANLGWHGPNANQGWRLPILPASGRHYLHPGHLPNPRQHLDAACL